MYSGYAQTNFGLAAKKMHKSKGKSCSYYMKIVFFFSSLIQSLIIASLVLFLVYGQPEQSVEQKRLQELDQAVSKLTMESFALREKEKNLTKHLNLTFAAKLISDKNVTVLKNLANTSAATIKGLQEAISRYELEKKMSIGSRAMCLPTQCVDSSGSQHLQSQYQHSEEMLRMVKTNFTQKMDIMKTELENSNIDKNKYHLEAIELRRDKAYLQEELKSYEKKCKEDFVDHMQGIPNVTKDFHNKIDELFSKHITFQLTCEKQRDQLRDIRDNCSRLSRDVENKLQTYIDIVASQITTINGQNAKVVGENVRLREDVAWCKDNRSAIVQENLRHLVQVQMKHDQDNKKLLLEIKKLQGDNKLMENLLSVKEKEIKIIYNTVETLNTSLISCKPPLRLNPFLPFMPPPNPGPGLGKPGYGYPAVGTAGSSFGNVNSVGTNTRWGPAGSSVSAPSGTGALSGDLGTTGQRLGRAGLVQTGTSVGGAVNAGTGQSAAGQSVVQFSSAGSIGLALGKPGTGSTGSNTAGNVGTLGGTRTTGNDNQQLNHAQINLHLKELHRYSLSN